jgi:murein DD-endopeptidase MepM/ murein hydrolase activator NlpD
MGEHLGTSAVLAGGDQGSGPFGGAARASLLDLSASPAPGPSTRRVSSSVRGYSSAATGTAATATARTSHVTTRALARARDASAQAKEQTTFTPAVRGRVTSGYGQRWGRMHHGMDFGAPYGAALRAVGAGTITTTDYNSGLGHHVRIRLEDGTEITYGHMSRISVVRGQRVLAGARLGDVGNSGTSTGAHLHLEVRTPQGQRVDPRPWLTRRHLL